MCMELGISRYGSHSGGGSAGANFHEPCKSPPVVTISLLCPLRHGDRPSSQKGYVTPTVHVQTLALEMPPKTHASLGVCTLLVVEKNQLGISPEGVCYPACYTVVIAPASTKNVEILTLNSKTLTPTARKNPRKLSE